MKISQKFPQFENQKALLIVAGRQEAFLYLAQDGEIDLLESERLQRPNYTFKESFFVRSGHGRTYGAGAIYEDLKGKKSEEFLGELERMVKEIIENHGITDIFIFSPNRVYHSRDKFIPHTHRDKVRKFIKGNFCKKHPFFLLEKIAEE